MLHRTNSLQTEMWNLYENEIWGDNSPSVNIKYPLRSEALPNYPAKVYRLEVGLKFVRSAYNELVHISSECYVRKNPYYNSLYT